MEWNKKLKLLREKKHLTQEDIAILCDVTPRTYWMWENAEIVPTRRSKKALAMAFNVPVNAIFENEENNDEEAMSYPVNLTLRIDKKQAKELFKQLCSTLANGRGE